MTDSPSTTQQDQQEPETAPVVEYRREVSTTPNVHEAMAEAMRLVRAVGKWGRNNEQGYSFRSIDHFMSALNPAMAAAGVHVAPTVLQRITNEDHTTQGGKIMRWVDVEMRFTFYGPAGDSFDVITWGEARDAADKATNKAMTGAFKYAIMQAFMVPTEDLDDADRHNPEVESGGAQQRQPQGQQQRQPSPEERAAAERRAQRRALANADPATVDALALELFYVCDETPPGPARDLGLRAIYHKADTQEALGCLAELPEEWKRGDVTSVTLWQLIEGARTITVPSGETVPDDSTDDGDGSAEDSPADAGPTEDATPEPDATHAAVQRARAAADAAATRSNQRMEEDPWATQG